MDTTEVATTTTTTANVEEAAKRKIDPPLPPLTRSPQSLNLASVDHIKLTLGDQRRLGCAMNEQVFLECPYAFVQRQQLLDVVASDSSTIGALVVEKIKGYKACEILVAYGRDRIDPDEPADYVICLTDESCEALVSLNRGITRTLRQRVRNEIVKTPRAWQDTEARPSESCLHASRAYHEIELSLPVSEIRSRAGRSSLSDRDPDEIRDGCIELKPKQHETFDSVEFLTVTRESQTNLQSKHQAAQTYPADPRHQWTQHEFAATEEFRRVWAAVVEAEVNADEEQPGDEPKQLLLNAADQVEGAAVKTTEELELERSRREAAEKLRNFIHETSDAMTDAVTFNASTNLHANDVANLHDSTTNEAAAFADAHADYRPRVSLIDLESVGDRHLFSVSWHCRVEKVLACVYMDEAASSSSLVCLWSLSRPLRPKVVLRCDQKVSLVSFCPLEDYGDVLVGGCLDGKIIVWEIDRQWLVDDDEDDSSRKTSEPRDPVIKKAVIAESSLAKYQTKSVTGIQWLPAWCHIEADGNFQKSTSISAKDRKAYFATSSTDGSIFFWCLPCSLSSPAAKPRSPLRLTIVPIYQLYVEEVRDKVSYRLPITCFSIPLAKNEESSSLSIRDQADLERLRKVIVGTSSGEVVCCRWGSQTFAVDATDREVCKVASRCCVHDGYVRTIAKSPHLDDVFLTVGGRVFALWKEDLVEAPIFHRRSDDCRYGDGCWSARAAIFVMVRLDGRFELWDLRKRSDEPILVQTVSGEITACIYPSPVQHRDDLLAISSGRSTLRVYTEPDEITRDEDISRIEWFEEFAWRETKRKRDFRRWQEEYLRKNPVALRRKAERDQAEVERRHREAKEKFLKLIGIVCMACGWHGFFQFVAISAFILTLIWCILYLFQLREALSKLPINWILTELFNTGLYAVLYFIAFIIQLIYSLSSPVYIAAGVFGLINTLLYAAGAYFLYLEHKNGQAQ